VKDLLEAGTDPSSLDTSSGLSEPCFEASAPHMELSENVACFQLRFHQDVSGPLVQQNSPAKPVLDTAQSFNVVFGSDMSSDGYRQTCKQTTSLYPYQVQVSSPPLGGSSENCLLKICWSG